MNISDGDLASSFSLLVTHNGTLDWVQLAWLTGNNSNHWRTNWIEAGRTNNCILKWVLHYLFHCKALLTFYFSWIYDFNLKRKIFHIHLSIHSLIVCYWVSTMSQRSWWGLERPGGPISARQPLYFTGSRALVYHQDSYIQVEVGSN